MSTLSGRDGYMLLDNSDLVGELNSWSVTISHDPVDVRVFQSSGWGAFQKGALSWTGSASGFYDCTDTAGQAQIQSDLIAGNSLDAYFYVSDSYYFYGTVWPTGQTIDTAVDGVVGVSFDFSGEGALNSYCG